MEPNQPKLTQSSISSSRRAEVSLGRHRGGTAGPRAGFEREAEDDAPEHAVPGRRLPVRALLRPVEPDPLADRVRHGVARILRDERADEVRAPRPDRPEEAAPLLGVRAVEDLLLEVLDRLHLVVAVAVEDEGGGGVGADDPR